VHGTIHGIPPLVGRMPLGTITSANRHLVAVILQRE